MDHSVLDHHDSPRRMQHGNGPRHNEPCDFPIQTKNIQKASGRNTPYKKINIEQQPNKQIKSKLMGADFSEAKKQLKTAKHHWTADVYKAIAIESEEKPQEPCI